MCPVRLNRDRKHCWVIRLVFVFVYCSSGLDGSSCHYSDLSFFARRFFALKLATCFSAALSGCHGRPSIYRRSFFCFFMPFSLSFLMLQPPPLFNLLLIIDPSAQQTVVLYLFILVLFSSLFLVINFSFLPV